MNMQVVKWGVDVVMGIVFLFSALTGLFKFGVLVRLPVLADTALPMAFISDIHDRAGILLLLLVAVHLFLNRGWIVSMTRKILAGTADNPERS